MAHQVFISYGHQDKLVADAACARLEARGIRCWIAPRDVLAGQSYGGALSNAIRSCSVLVLVFSSHANLSEHVSKEVERAVSHSIPVVPLRIENVAPTGALDYFIGSVHWLDALTDPIDQHLERLADTVERLLGQSSDKRVPPPLPKPKPKPWMRYALIGGGAVSVLVLTAVVLSMFRGGSPRQDFAQAARPMMETPAAEPPASARQTATAPTVTPKTTAAPAGTPEPAQTRTERAAEFAEPQGLIGCWMYNGVNLQMQPDGRISGTLLQAQWRATGGNRYSMHWPPPEDSVVLASDGRSLTGANNFGIPISAQRTAPGSRGLQSLAGLWQWNGASVTVSDNGIVTAGMFRGRWESVGGLEFKVTWPNDPPVDRLTMSSDGQHVSGQNQFGVQVSGDRVPCP